MGTNQKGLASLAQSFPSGREEPWRSSVRGLSEARQDFVYSSNRKVEQIEHLRLVLGVSPALSGEARLVGGRELWVYVQGVIPLGGRALTD
jgi:hypothetical protein